MLVMFIPRPYSGLERMCPDSASRHLVLVGSDGGGDLVVELVNLEGLAVRALHDGSNPGSVLATDVEVSLPMTWSLSLRALDGAVVHGAAVHGAHRSHEAGRKPIWTGLASTRLRFGAKSPRQSTRFRAPVDTEPGGS